MRFVPKSRKKMAALVALILSAVLVMTGCSSSSKKNTFNAQDVACTQVSPQLTAAQKTLQTDQAKAKSSKGTPAEKQANAAVTTDQQKIADLGQRSVTCQKSAVPPYHQRAASQCDAGFNVIWDKNKEDNLISDGVPRSKFPTAQSAIKYLVDAMKHDSRVLFVYYVNSPEQKLSPVTSEKELRGTGINDGCYSAKGQQVWNAMVTELAHAKIKNVAAPAVGVNTGANPGGSAFQVAPGPITGNRDSVQIIYENGQAAYMLRRCGNLEVLVPIPHVPVKPPTTPPGTTPPPQQCKQPWYAFHNGYKEIAPCVWVKDNSNTFQCQQNDNDPRCPNNPAHQPVQSPGNGVQSTATNPVPGVSTEPSPLPSGPGGTQAPPTTNAPSGYNPGPSGAPGGGSSNGGSTTVNTPKPNPTPSCSVSCGSGTQTQTVAPPPAP